MSILMPRSGERDRRHQSQEQALPHSLAKLQMKILPTT